MAELFGAVQLWGAGAPGAHLPDLGVCASGAAMVSGSCSAHAARSSAKLSAGRSAFGRGRCWTAAALGDGQGPQTVALAAMLPNGDNARAARCRFERPFTRSW